MSPEEDRTCDAVDNEPKHYQRAIPAPSQAFWYHRHWQKPVFEWTLPKKLAYTDSSNSDNNENHIERRNSRCFQSTRSAANCLPHVCLSGQRTIVYKSSATHQALTTCNTSLAATWYEGTAQQLSLTELYFIVFFFFCVRCDDRAKSSGRWLLGSPPSAVVRQLAPRAWCPLQCLLAKTVGVLSPGVGRSEECAQGFAPQNHIHSGLNQQDLVSLDVFLAHSDQYADGRWWFGSSCQGCYSGLSVGHIHCFLISFGWNQEWMKEMRQSGLFHQRQRNKGLATSTQLMLVSCSWPSFTLALHRFRWAAETNKTKCSTQLWRVFTYVYVCMLRTAWHTCCTWWALDVLHVICTRLGPGHSSSCVGENSWRSGEIVKDMKFHLSVWS